MTFRSLARGAIASSITLCCLVPSVFARENGLPVARTGAFGQQTCSGASCHRSAPLRTNGTATATIEVGSYVPGATQEVRVILESRGSRSFGFQLTARRADDVTKPAGRFSSTSLFSAVRCADGRLAANNPCGADQVEYVTHTSAGAQSGQGQPGRFVYFFDWKSPAGDVGEVIFAAAALGADGDKGTNNDITINTQTRSLFAPTNSPRFNTGGAVSAAALQRRNQAIAPKQIITIFGANLAAPGTAFTAGIPDFELGLLPTELNRLSVIFRVPNDLREYLGRIVFVNDKQVNLQAPDFPAGAETVMMQPVINRGRGGSEIRGAMIEAPGQSLAPGLFVFDQSGVGEAAAFNGQTLQPISLNPAINNRTTAREGDVLTFYGTGFGPTNPDFAAGELANGAAPLPGGVSVEIGGAQAAVEYAGAAPNFAGLIQFNVRAPKLPSGQQSVFVRKGGFITQAGVTIPFQ